MERRLNKFASFLVKLEPVEFIGVARILCVELMNKEKQPKDFWDIFREMLEKFPQIPKSQQKQLLGVLKENATKPKN